MPIGPGTRLGSYVVQDFIGQGAMGVVYRAYHAQLERSCAVKVLQSIGSDRDSYGRFQLEAQAIAHMRHPNIVNVFDFGEFEGQPYMIVEFVEGGSLLSRLKGAPLDHKTALAYLHEIADALDYAHSLGIVHRDVKPANVLLGPGDTPILADFGLVKLMQAASIASMTGATTGTPAYMAPEQVSGKHVGPAADLYSLAVVAYEMLTGSFPFDEPGVLEVLYAHVHKEPAAASTVNPWLGPRTDAVLLRGLAKDPAMRWETCESMVTALEQTLRAAGPATERTIVYEPPAPIVGAPAVATEPWVANAGPATAVMERPEAKAAISRSATVAVALPQPIDRKRRRRTGAVIGAAALVLVLLIGGVCLFQATRPPTLDVSPHVAAYGQHVAVTATHLPRNQSGQIRLESVLHTFAFRAADNGNVTFDLTVPSDIETGDHTVSICWSGSCHAQTKLRVVSGVAETSPLPPAPPSGSPTGSPSASPSPTGNPTSQPGSTPHPGSTPTSAPRSSPSPTPTHAPSPSPTPSSNPCPPSTSGAKLTESPGTVLAGLTPVTISGQNFTPNSTATIKYFLGSTLKQTWTRTVSCSGTFSVQFTPGALDIGTAKVTGVDSGGRAANVTFSIT